MWGAGRGFAPCRVRAGRLLPNPKAAPARAGPLGKLSVRRRETTTGGRCAGWRPRPGAAVPPLPGRARPRTPPTPKSWSPGNRPIDRSGRSPIRCPPNSRGSGTARTSRGVSTSARKPTRPPRPSSRRKRTASPGDRCTAPPARPRLRAPVELPGRYLRGARHDRRRRPLGPLVPAHRQRAHRAHHQPGRHRLGVAQRALFRSPRLRQTRHKLLADHHPRTPLPLVLPASQRTPLVARQRSLISRRGSGTEARQPDAAVLTDGATKGENPWTGEAQASASKRETQRSAATALHGKGTLERQYPVTADPRDRETAESQCRCGIAAGHDPRRLP